MKVRGDTQVMGIRRARAAELAVVQEIDRASGQMFSEVGRSELCEMLWSPEALAECQAAGRLWVITGSGDRPAGFLITEVVDGCLQVEQVSVHPGCARRGLGRALLDHAVRQAEAAGLPAVTLTTFADVPWNAPYYERCGFRVLDDTEITAGLQAIREREAAFGLDQWPRVCMRRDV
jgi:ribosomal protein S18 acetylase RimI-like enzyme